MIGSILIVSDNFGSFTVAVDRFIKEKSPQFCYFIRYFLNEELPFSELQLFIWDLLEEWHQLKTQNSPYTLREQVFWYVVHLLSRWGDEQLRGNLFLRRQLSDCMSFLEGSSPPPPGCTGIRP